MTILPTSCAVPHSARQGRGELQSAPFLPHLLSIPQRCPPKAAPCSCIIARDHRFQAPISSYPSVCVPSLHLRHSLPTSRSAT